MKALKHKLTRIKKMTHMQLQYNGQIIKEGKKKLKTSCHQDVTLIRKSAVPSIQDSQPVLPLQIPGKYGGRPFCFHPGCFAFLWRYFACLVHSKVFNGNI